MSSKQVDRSEEGLGPLERGAKRYHNKDYNLALEAFNEAVSISTGHMLVTALDHRAATYEKMTEYKKALKDAKAMIEEQPASAKGYLRSGKILQLWDKETLALQIYELGLKRVKVGEDEKRPMLQSMLSKLQRRQNPEKTYDPLVFLPSELAEIVAQYMDMRTRVLCLCVSKPWKRFLESCPKLWTCFDTRKAKRPLTLKSLQAFLRRANGSVDKAYLSLYSAGAGLDVNRFKYLLKHCKKLKYLELIRGGFVGETLTDALTCTSSLTILIVSKCEIMIPFVKTILKTCPQLVAAEFHNVKNRRPIGHANAWAGKWSRSESLEKFRMSCIDGISSLPSQFLLGIMDATPNMRHLHITGWAHDGVRSTELLRFDIAWPLLETLNLDNTPLFRLPCLPRTLTHLYMNGSSRVEYLEPRDILDRMTLPKLEAFCCCNVDSGLAGYNLITTLIGASMKSGSLKTLWIDHLDVAERYEFPMCESLEILSFGHTRWPQPTLTKFVMKFPNLKFVDLSWTDTTGVLVKKLLTTEGGKVQYLRLFQCDKMSVDTITFARSMGVAVDLRQAIPLLGRRS